METRSFSLSFSCFLVAVNVNSKDTKPNRRTQKLKKPFRCDVRLFSRQLVCFLFFSLSMWQVTNHMIRSFFLSFVLSFFFTFIFLSLRLLQKTSEISPSTLSFFPSFLNIMCTDRQLFTKNTHVLYY